VKQPVILILTCLPCISFPTYTDNRHLWADCLDSVGFLTSHNHLGLQGLLRDSFTFTFYFYKYKLDDRRTKISLHQLSFQRILVPWEVFISDVRLSAETQFPQRKENKSFSEVDAPSRHMCMTWHCARKLLTRDGAQAGVISLTFLTGKWMLTYTALRKHRIIRTYQAPAPISLQSLFFLTE
jgi:hypothetical protein